jgi:hypothetical protein
MHIGWITCTPWKKMTRVQHADAMLLHLQAFPSTVEPLALRWTYRRNTFACSTCGIIGESCVEQINWRLSYCQKHKSVLVDRIFYQLTPINPILVYFTVIS